MTWEGHSSFLEVIRWKVEWVLLNKRKKILENNGENGKGKNSPFFF